MTTPKPEHRVRVSFEPNRFSDDHLIGVYEKLKPVESYRSDRNRLSQRDNDKNNRIGGNRS